MPDMQTILLLHGAIGASVQLRQLADSLEDEFNVKTLDFSGHGGKPSSGSPFSMQLFADEVLRLIDDEKLETVSIFGYSMGGYVGMYLARYHPQRVNKVVTLATKYHWDEATAAKEVQMLNPDKIEQKVPAFATALQKMHAPNDWKQLMHQTAEMMLSLGKDNPLKQDDYPQIQAPSLVLLGDRDKMVTLDETVAVYKALPNAQMGVLPNTPHPIEQVNVDVLAYFIRRFMR